MTDFFDCDGCAGDACQPCPVTAWPAGEARKGPGSDSDGRTGREALPVPPRPPSGLLASMWNHPAGSNDITRKARAVARAWTKGNRAVSDLQPGMFVTHPEHGNGLVVEGFGESITVLHGSHPRAKRLSERLLRVSGCSAPWSSDCTGLRVLV